MGYLDSSPALPGLSPESVTNLGSISKAAPAGAASFNPAMALGGLAIEGASAWYNNRQAQKRQREAFDQQKWLFSNRYQMQTKDMMAAGLNPMLAVSQGAPSPSTPGQAPTTKPDLSGAMAQATLASAQAHKTRQETENLKVENFNLQTTAGILIQNITKTQNEIDEIESRMNVNKASEKEIQKRTELMNYQKELLSIQAKLGLQEYQTKRPEQIASGTQAAETAATIQRALKPLFDLLEGAARATR